MKKRPAIKKIALSKNLKTLRDHLNYNQQAMAKAAKCTVPAWCAYEKGRMYPNLNRIQTVIETFNIVNVYGFLYDEEWTP